MRLIFIIILLAALASSGCDPNANGNKNQNGNANTTATFKPPSPITPKEVVDPNFTSCNPYYPLVPGSVAKYVLNYSSGMVADATVVVDSEEQEGRKVFVERTQIVDRSGGLQQVQSTVKKYVCDGGRIQIISERNETRVQDRESVNENLYRDNTVAIVDPAALAQKGSTWSMAFNQTFQSPGEAKATSPETVFVALTVTGPEETTIPTGKVKTVAVQRKVKDNLSTDYYARGLGMVKRVAAEGTTWELREYSGLKPMD